MSKEAKIITVDASVHPLPPRGGIGLYYDGMAIGWSLASHSVPHLEIQAIKFAMKAILDRPVIIHTDLKEFAKYVKPQPGVKIVWQRRNSSRAMKIAHKVSSLCARAQRDFHFKATKPRSTSDRDHFFEIADAIIDCSITSGRFRENLCDRFPIPKVVHFPKSWNLTPWTDVSYKGQIKMWRALAYRLSVGNMNGSQFDRYVKAYEREVSIKGRIVK